MNKIGRNTPCPCGSGKKYKRCCLSRNEDDARLESLSINAPGIALDWLFSHHGEASGNAVKDVLSKLDDPARDALAKLPTTFQSFIDINLHEWLLAEGYLNIGGRQVAVRELILGKGGPLMDATHRGFLEKLFTASMSLYEVTEVRRGQGFEVLDVLRPEMAKAVWVQEGTASLTAQVGEVLGARLIPGDPVTLSGAVYPFSGLDHLLLQQELMALLEFSENADDTREGIGIEILTAWLHSLVAPPPKIVDAASGDPLVLVTDHYRVSDWEALEEAFADLPNVVGDRSEGWTVCVTEMEDEDELVDEKEFVDEVVDTMAFLSLSPGSDGLLEVFSRSISQADEGRQWLTITAELGLEFHIREIVDPMSPAAQEAAAQHPDMGATEIPPEEVTQVFQQVLHRLYANWADEPLGICGGQTPRQAIKDLSGRREVIAVIRSYEQNERTQAADAGREPASFDFLWQDLGLTPKG